MAFVTANIILMPHMGAALTTLIGMFADSNGHIDRSLWIIWFT